MIDPQDPEAYRSAILDWSEPTAPAHAEVLDLYRRLIALRAAEPDLRDGDLRRVQVDFDEDARWLVVHRGRFRVAANLSAAEQRLPVTAARSSSPRATPSPARASAARRAQRGDRAGSASADQPSAAIGPQASRWRRVRGPASRRGR